MGLNEHQSAALQKLLAFTLGEDTVFGLEGGAGTGKTYLLGVLVKELMLRGHRVLVAAPTHKACRVLRSKLDAWGVRWDFKPQHEVPVGVAIVDTTAALLGIRPVIDDEQDEDELTFKPAGGGSIGKLFEGNLGLRPVLIIDEASMLGRDELLQLADRVRGQGQIICVGDDGQLPPVKKKAIDFLVDFEDGAGLAEPCRQAKGSMILSLAWAIRTGDARRAVDEVTGGGDVERMVDGNVSQAYVDEVVLPVDDETQRSVYVAYRNAVVHAVQDQCCKKLYGHGALDFEPGQLVIASSPGYREERYWTDSYGVKRLSRWPKMEQVVANADQLRIHSISEAQDPVFGRHVYVDRVDLPENAPKRRFDTHYLSEAQLADAAHPFNVEKKRLLAKAKELQAQLKQGYSQELDTRRKDAWGAFFKHQQQVLSFQHPFAITAHKSQGSTYREAFVNTADLLRFDPRALYVAVTRPSRRLVL